MRAVLLALLVSLCALAYERGVPVIAGEFTMPGERTHERLPSSGVPDSALHAVGEVVATAATTCPARSIEANGSAVSRTKYGMLFVKMGVIYGSGDGSTTFTLPDYRGKFLRGWNHGTTNDPDVATRTTRGDGTTGDAVGTQQADQFLSHTHSFSSVAIEDTSATGVSTAGQPKPNTTTFTTSSTGGLQTNPINVNVLFCIFTG